MSRQQANLIQFLDSEMLQLKASLESVRTRKNVTDDILQTVIFSVWGSADQIGELNELYRKPLQITIDVVI